MIFLEDVFMVVVTPIIESYSVVSNVSDSGFNNYSSIQRREKLGKCFSGITRYVEMVQMNNEIIVVDDGSTDKTKEVAFRNGAKVLSNKINQGKGYSLRCGFEYAKGEIIVTMDADGSHDPKDIEKLVLTVLNGADIAVGSRFNTMEGRKTTTQVNLFGNRLISHFISDNNRKPCD